MIRGLSLYSGIGGFNLALKAAGLETQEVMYVEKEPFCQKILQARIKDGLLDDAPIWPDVFTLPCKQLAGLVDLITAGFPCQPFSVAGTRRGEQDSRNLWPITAEVIGKIRPSFILLENVPGLVAPGGGQPPYALTVLGNLAEMGYDAVWGIVGARNVGAPHKRDRWWCLGYSPQFRLSGKHRVGLTESCLQHWRNMGHANQLPAWPPGPKDRDSLGKVLAQWPELAPATEIPQSSLRGMAHGVSHRVDRIRALDNAIVPAQGALALHRLIEVSWDG